jgi:short-subunit dehydrogenase
MYLKQKYGSTALIAGASEGIGAAFATLLAQEGIDLILVARREEPLQQLADSLIKKYQIKVKCLQRDLSENNAAEKLVTELRDNEINILVYNAALSYIGQFIQNTLEQQNEAARLNMITPMNLVRIYGEKMLAQRKGAIILMSSLAGFQGSGFLSVYASTKAFNRILAESLWYEWKNSGVDIIACVAGATSTPGYINSKPERISIFAPRVLQPAEVAGECISKLGKQPSFITGGGNRIASFIMQKIIPRKMAINIMGDTTKKMYRL